MWRAAATACVVVLLALPGAASAAQPAPYTEIGPPAALGAIAFATDGTVYGTVAAPAPRPHARTQPYTLPDSDPGLWQSRDHGRTWTARYRAPPGTRLVVLAASPAGSGTAFASVGPEAGPVGIERIDAERGVATPLPLGVLLGVDRAGTAYGFRSGDAATLLRCRLDAVACDELPVPSAGAQIVVDPGSVGLLAASASLATAAPPIELSTDGGSTWSARATPAYGCTCNIAFGGPAPGTLYELTGPQWFSVSHDGALTWSAPIRAPENVGVVAGSGPPAFFPVATDYPLSPVVFTGDDGATFRPVDFPTPGPLLAIDPVDLSHLFLLQRGRATQSYDGGRTWAAVADRGFGTVAIDPARVEGAGASIYAAIGDSGSGESIWSSGDRGTTWTELPLPVGTRTFGIFVSRDDPRTAYVTEGGNSQPAGLERTRDGGRTWHEVPGQPTSALSLVLAGDPLHLYSGGLVGGQESLDGGDTWTPVADDRICANVTADADPASPTGLRLHCVPYGRGIVPSVLGPRPLPIAFGISGAPGAPGAFALARGGLLGDIQPDGSWRSLLATTGGLGPTADDGLAQASWPARDGTVFYAIERDPLTTWVRREAGHWWHLQHDGLDLVLIAPLDATHALVAPRDARAGSPLAGKAPLAVLDLTEPDLAVPAMEGIVGGRECDVPWTAAEARITAYAWSRDGVVLPGAIGRRRGLSRLDRGRTITCTVTAATTFGSTRLSSPPVRTPGTRIAIPRPRVSGAGVVGATVRCSAAARITWYRGIALVARAHGRTYVVRRQDAGHSLACETHLKDGTVTRSRALRIGRAGA